MLDNLVIYYNIIDSSVFDVNGSLLGNSVLSAFLGNSVTLEIHYVTEINSADPEDWTKWTGVAGKSIASSLAMDTDYRHAADGTLSTALSGTITTVQATGAEIALAYSGFIELTNSSGQKETIAYSSAKYENGSYSFTVNTTLAYNYQSGDSIRIPDSLILKLEGDYVDDSRAGEGIFLFDLKLLSKKILDSLDFGNTRSLSVIAQHKIISKGNIINTFEFPFQINNVLE